MIKMNFLQWFGCCLIVVSIFYIHIGLHNIDMSWNMAYIEYEFDTELEETTFSNQRYSKEELYKLGNLQCWVSSLVIVIGILAFVFPMPEKNK